VVLQDDQIGESGNTGHHPKILVLITLV